MAYAYTNDFNAEEGFVSDSSDEEEEERVGPVGEEVAEEMTQVITRIACEEAMGFKETSLSGNVYLHEALGGTIAAMRVNTPNFCADIYTSGKQCFAWRYMKMRIVKKCGLLSMLAVQIIGPPAVLFWGIYCTSESWPNIWFGFWPLIDYRPGSDTHGISRITKKIMSFLFIVMFILSAIYEADTSARLSKKIERLCDALSNRSLLKKIKDKVHKKIGETEAQIDRGLLSEVFHDDEHLDVVKKRMNDPKCVVDTIEKLEGLLKDEYPLPKLRWLYVHAIVNVWVLAFSALAIVPLFWVAENPRDVILDAFGLALLYKLDDSGAELGFLTDEWPEKFLKQLLKLVGKDTNKFQRNRCVRICKPYVFFRFLEGFLWLCLYGCPIVFLFARDVEFNEEVEKTKFKERTCNLAQGTNYSCPPSQPPDFWVLMVRLRNYCTK